jgi:hypothetical protein
MTALQGWIVIGLLVLIVLGIVGIGAEIEALLAMAYLQSIAMLSCPPAASRRRGHGALVIFEPVLVLRVGHSANEIGGDFDISLTRSVDCVWSWTDA